MQPDLEYGIEVVCSLISNDNENTTPQKSVLLSCKADIGASFVLLKLRLLFSDLQISNA